MSRISNRLRLTAMKTSTFLWFESNAEQAARFYCETVPGAKLGDVTSMSASFEIEGQRYIAFNGGSANTLSNAVSIFIHCETQAQVDQLWDRFIAGGGTESRCGWLVDRFGLSWQIIPNQLLGLISASDPAKRNRAMQSMMSMNKIDIAAMQRAHDGT
jgi:predicted 3-demethylubiquinone-9 3-methyltransferase (glyoxalase superfamily)